MSLSGADLRPELIHAVGGLAVLFAAMVLSVFKPWGLTAYGRPRIAKPNSPVRASNRQVQVREPSLATRWGWTRIAWIHVIHAIGVVLLVAIVLHISGGGMRHH